MGGMKVAAPDLLLIQRFQSAGQSVAASAREDQFWRRKNSSKEITRTFERAKAETDASVFNSAIGGVPQSLHSDIFHFMIC